MQNFKKHIVQVSLALAILMLAGCGYSINYSNIKADLQYSGSRSVAVGVLDERPYVLSADKEPSYVGTMRGGYGNPFDVSTESKMQLADDMAATIADSLRNKGFKVVAVKAAVGRDSSSVLSPIGSAGAERLVIMDVKDWYSDYYPASWGPERAAVVMNVELKVMDSSRKVLGSSRLEGTETPPSGWPKDTIPGYYQKKISELFNDRSIQSALK